MGVYGGDAMAEQFPMFRLVTLLMRQLSTPVASHIKKYALRHPAFSEHVCRGCARVYLAAEWRVRVAALRLSGVGPPASMPPPADSARRETDLGGDLLGELIIFTLGAIIVVFEVNRQATNHEAKVQEERSQWAAAMRSLRQLQSELVLQQERLDRLAIALQRLQDK